MHVFIVYFIKSYKIMLTIKMISGKIMLNKDKNDVILAMLSSIIRKSKHFGNFHILSHYQIDLQYNDAIKTSIISIH